MPSPKISFSLNAWCRAIGIQEKTLAIRLTKAGTKINAYGEITARQIIDAMCGGKDESIIRLNNSKAEAIEQKQRVKNGELVDLPVAERVLWAELLFPLKQELDLMPSKLAPLVSPDNPKAAQKLIFEEVEKIKNKLMKRKKS